MTSTPAIERPPRAYRLVHYHYDPFLGGQFPIGAIVREGDEERFVRAPRMPDLRDYPGNEVHLAFMLRWFGPRGPYTVPAPNVTFGDERALPGYAADPAAWALDTLAGGKRTGRRGELGHPETPLEDAILAILRNERALKDVDRDALRSLAERLDRHLRERVDAGASRCVEAVRQELRHRQAITEGLAAPARGDDLAEGPPPVERIQEHYERHGGDWLVTRVFYDHTAPERHRPLVLRIRHEPGERYNRIAASFPGVDVGGFVEEGRDAWRFMRGARFIPLGADGLPLAAAPAAPPAVDRLDALDLWAAGAEAALDACAATLAALVAEHERDADAAKVCGGGPLAEVPEAERANAQLARLAMMCGLACAKALKGARGKVLALPVPTPPLTRPAVPDDVLVSVWIGDAVVELERRRRASPPRRVAPAVTVGERRAETGIVQFGDDWPGVFIRGDVAHAWAHSLSALGVGADLDDHSAADIASGRAVQLVMLADLRELLLRSNARNQGHRVDALLLPFPACAGSPPLVHLMRASSALAGLDNDALDAVTPEAMRRVLERRGWKLAGVNRLAGDSSVVAFEVHHHDTARATCRQRGTMRSVLLPAVRLADYRLRVADWCEAVASRHGDVAPAVVLAEALAEVGR